ncbi:hypothetical protein [Micromonospora sp. KLBMP9576]|uniref:hypothetical protein n=1 Tax=Micromonospora sp. KLBMP9576 TaxID=3424769 RepID=UPI003D8FC73B
MTTPAQPSSRPADGGPPPGHPGGAPVIRRIPEDQPYVVRPHLAKRALASVGILLVVVLPFAFVYLRVVSAAGPEMRYEDALYLFDVVAYPLVLVGTPLGCQLWLVRSVGPVLALGPAGLWVRTRPTWGQAVWLPWEGVARVSRRRRWSRGKMLVVTPHDTEVLHRFGVSTRVDGEALRSLRDFELTATLDFADRPESEIMAAVARYSKGRCQLG